MRGSTQSLGAIDVQALRLRLDLAQQFFVQTHIDPFAHRAFDSFHALAVTCVSFGVYVSLDIQMDTTICRHDAKQ